MKTFKVLLVVLGLLLCVAAAQCAEQLWVDAQGNVHVELDSRRSLTPQEQQAVRSPGVPVGTGQADRTFIRVDFLHGQTVRTYAESVIFKGRRLVPGSQPVVQRGDVFFLLHPVLLILAMGCMVVGHVVRGRIEELGEVVVLTAFAATFVAFAAFVATLAADAPVSHVTTLAAFATTFAALAAAVASATVHEKYTVWVWAFYLLAVAAMRV